MKMEALAWTLIHFVWQAPIMAGLLALALATLDNRAAKLRYAIACATLLALSAMPLLTYAKVAAQQSITPSTVEHRVNLQGGGEIQSPAENTSPLLGWVPWIWMVGVSLFSLRLVAGTMAIHRLQSGGREVVDCWQSVAACIGVRRPVRFLESARVRVPTVIGWLKPVILLPLGSLISTPQDHMEAVIAHELAHIVRHDYLVNWFQLLIETVLFYHPAVWWISSVIRREREHCCDDLAVAIHGERAQYVKALLSFEEYRHGELATLAANGGDLVSRVRRLLEPPRRNGHPLAALVVLALAIGTLFLSPGVRAQSQSTSGPYQKWLNEDVVYIIEPAERQRFLSLRADAEYEQFIAQFWLRRDPSPGTTENEFKEEHYRRIFYSNERFGEAATSGWRTDRGRIYIQLGPSDEKEVYRNNSEKWRYIKLDRIIEFSPSGQIVEK